MQGKFALNALAALLIGLMSAPAAARGFDFFGWGGGVSTDAGLDSGGSSSSSSHSADQCPGGRVAPPVIAPEPAAPVEAHPGAAQAAQAPAMPTKGAATPQSKPALLRWQSHLPGAMK